jgi:hypothetical protein
MLRRRSVPRVATSSSGSARTAAKAGACIGSVARQTIQPGASRISVDIRLGPVDLEMLDALITAGTAASRAEAVGWVPGPHPRTAGLREAQRAGTRAGRAQSLLLTPADRQADSLGAVTMTRCAPEP